LYKKIKISKFKEEEWLMILSSRKKISYSDFYAEDNSEYDIFYLLKVALKV